MMYDVERAFKLEPVPSFIVVPPAEVSISIRTERRS